MAKIGCAKCGGTKKMALGGSAVKKAPVQLYGIPQQNMGTSSQMGFGKKGGTLNEMARGGTKKSSSAKIVQQFTRKTLSDKALAARTAGANKANAGKIASKSNLPAKTVKAGLPAKTVKAGLPAKTVKVAAKAPVKAPAKVITMAQLKALDAAKKASTGSKTVGTGLKVISKVPAKVAKINFTEVAKKGGKNWKKLAGYAALGAGAYALDSYNNSKTTKPAAKPKVKPGTNKGALSKMVTPNKVGDNVKVTPKPVIKPVVSTKTNTNKDGTKTTTYTDAKGIKHVKVVKKDGTTFTSNNKPKPAVVTPPKDTKKTTPVVKTDTKKTEVKKDTKTPEVKTPEATATPTVSSTTTPKVTPKMVDENKNGISDFVERPADEVTKMETKKPSDLKIIEPTTKTSSTPSSSTSTTVPRANLINRVRGSINASRERRAERAEERGNNEKATKLRDKEKVTKAKMMMKKGGAVKAKKK